jgi:hypothetical protein
VAQLAGAVAGALLTKGDPAGRRQRGELRRPGGLGRRRRRGLSRHDRRGARPFFLLWAIIGVAVHPRAAKDWAAFAIGGALGMGVMVLAPITGAGFNPARSFGPMLVSGEWGDFFVVYLIGPLVGALMAAVVYFYVFVQPGKKGDEGMTPVG